MVDGSIQDNPDESKVAADPLVDSGLVNQELELPAKSPPDQILEVSVTDEEASDPFDNSTLLSSSTPPGMEADIKNMELGGEHLELPGETELNMETPSIPDPIGLADAIPNTVKASTLNATLGNDVLEMDTIRNIKVNVQAVLGGISMSVSKLSNLKEGELVSLEKTIGEEIEILANGQLIAHGEIVVIEGDIPKFGITITSIVGS